MPTQAQIDAALSAAITDKDREYASNCWDDMASDGDETAIDIIAQWIRKARHEAALTAAAEVGQTKVVRREPSMQERINDTIDRCAQVADDGSEYGAFIAKKIRAMKDKP